MSSQPQNQVWVRVCALTEIDPGRAKGFSINGQPLVAALCAEGVSILQGTCSHMWFPLSGSPVDGCALTCQLHHSKFDVRDGSVQEWATFPPVIGAALAAIRQSKMLRRYPAKIEDGALYIQWPAEDPSSVRVKV
jgi:3-phenylpropionate/trans-cinnamate dioxygenase ferredoxin subunit